ERCSNPGRGTKNQTFGVKFSRPCRDCCIAHGLMRLRGPGVSSLKRRGSLDLHNLLVLLAKAKFGLCEELIDHIIAAANPIVDQIMIAIGAGDKQRRRLALVERRGKFDVDARAIVKGANRLPGNIVTADAVTEV